MKYIVISADGDSKVYSVPDAVADNLREYCWEFHEWLINSPHAEKYRIHGMVCYNEEDFIEYLNEWLFPEQKSVFVENLGWIDENFPMPYTRCPYYNF